ncbi:hypothetical protein E4U01_06850 [Streptococcus acidominimus]|uniref:Uncharacterized protein n=1 Tax=Streptococcus acidominimus TaxID=1326 RepID=A0A4Y9FM20_STRAI|nr:hypothetical protein E4U01_06850 [Streptococcus acidominimus]
MVFNSESCSCKSANSI